MIIDLTRDAIWFLKASRAAGERGRIVGALAAHAGLARLVEAHYVTQNNRRANEGRCTSSPMRERGVRHAVDTIEEMQKLLLGYRDNMRVEIEHGTPVTANENEPH
jgi:hypothetical protein